MQGILADRCAVVDRLLVDGDTVVALATWTATVVNDAIGAPIGTTLRSSIVQVFTVREGAIASCTDYVTLPVPG